MIICTSCQSGLEPAAVTSHLLNVHKLKDICLTQDSIDKVCEEFKIPASLPSIQGPLPEIEGLVVLTTALQCKICRTVRGSLSSIKKHYSQNHPGNALETIDVTAQRLSQQPPHNAYFPVIPTNKQLLTLPIDLNLLRTECDMAYVSFISVDVDKRTISPWLLTTGWHTHIAGYDIQKLRKLVEMPQPQEALLSKLEKGTTAVMQRGVELMKDTPLLVLQKLNSPDPIKEWVVLSVCSSLN